MSFRTIVSPATGKRLPWDELRELVIPQLHIHGCGFSVIDNWNSNGEVMTPFWCLWYAMNKGGWIEKDGTCWELGPKCIVMRPPQIIYSRHSNQPIQQLWLHFSLKPDYVFKAHVPYKIPVDSLFREQITAIIDAYDATDGDGVRVLYHHAAALLNTCFARHPLPVRHLPEPLRAVLQQIESAPSEDLSNSKLARLSGMSTNSFITWFESYMNTPPATYVRNVRYQKACRMLVFSDLSIEQIADQLGYPNRHYLSRVFIKRAGCGPATFRKEHQQYSIDD